MITFKPLLAETRRLLVTQGLLLASLLTAGCATAPDTSGIAEFRHAVANADLQTTKTFTDVNAFLRERQLDGVVAKGELDEASFPVVLATEDIAKWHQAFQVLDRYGQALQTLLDPKRRTAVEDSLAGLGTAIQQQAGGGELPSGMAAAFSTLGGLLLQIKTQEDAKVAMQTAAPGIKDVVATMRDAIGERQDEGIRATVLGSWKTVLGGKATQFKHATGPAERRTAAAGFAAALDQRDAQDQALVALRRSLELLEATHSELAAGRPDSAREFLKLLQAERARWEARQDAIERARAAETSK